MHDSAIHLSALPFLSTHRHHDARFLKWHYLPDVRNRNHWPSTPSTDKRLRSNGLLQPRKAELISRLHAFALPLISDVGSGLDAKA